MKVLYHLLVKELEKLFKIIIIIQIILQPKRLLCVMIKNICKLKTITIMIFKKLKKNINKNNRIHYYNNHQLYLNLLNYNKYNNNNNNNNNLNSNNNNNL